MGKTKKPRHKGSAWKEKQDRDLTEKRGSGDGSGAENKRESDSSKELQASIVEGVWMPELQHGKSLQDDNPLYGTAEDDSLINSFLAQNEKWKDAVSEEAVFGPKQNPLEKVCPKCGMPLMGKSDYCVGCGMNTTPPSRGNTYSLDGANIRGAAYGGGNAYVAREKALKLRYKKKKNILEENGLTGFLLITFGIIAGFLIGIFVLKAYFAPKDTEVTLFREDKVARIARIKAIKVGKSTAPLLDADGNLIMEDPLQSPQGQNGVAGQATNGQNSAGQTSTAQGSGKKQKNEYFYGKMTIQASGDKVTYMEETEEWDTTGLDPTDVSYVINNLNILYEKYQNYVFLENEVIQEENTVRLHFVFRNLDLEDNIRTMVSLGIIKEEAVAGAKGRQFISLFKLQELLDEEGWQTE